MPHGTYIPCRLPAGRHDLLKPDLVAIHRKGQRIKRVVSRCAGGRVQRPNRVYSYCHEAVTADKTAEYLVANPPAKTGFSADQYARDTRVIQPLTQESFQRFVALSLCRLKNRAIEKAGVITIAQGNLSDPGITNDPGARYVRLVMKRKKCATGRCYFLRVVDFPVGRDCTRLLMSVR